MRLSKAVYYADFYVYPLLILGLSAWELSDAALWQQTEWLSACALGLGSWTFAEYVLHRFLLHRVPFLHEMHEAHHDSPAAMIGTPVWVSLATIAGISLPLWRETAAGLAGGLTSGLMLGYLWYIVVHHAVHHWRLEHDTYLYRLKRRHARHHYGRVPCNFGVTTVFWDRLFGTADPNITPGLLSRAVRH